MTKIIYVLSAVSKKRIKHIAASESYELIMKKYIEVTKIIKRDTGYIIAEANLYETKEI